MKYKLFGNSGLRVSELCLGTMTFGTDWKWGATKEESQEIYNTYIEAGGNFIDTANRYTNGTSEKFVGEFIAPHRNKIVLATKYTMSTDPKDPNASGNHRKNMMHAVEDSLKRLNTDYIDLYWVHAYDRVTPIEEMMRGLDDLVRSGKVLYIGISDAPAWVVSKANVLAELKSWTQFAGLQIEYSLTERSVEGDLIPMADHFGLAIAAWSPLSRGLLSGKFNSKNINYEETRLKETSAHFTERNLSIADEVIKIAGEINKKPSQVALRWLLQNRNNVIPIIGVRSKIQLEENMKCLIVDLSPEQIEILNDISEPGLAFPHKLLKSENVMNLVYGDNKLT
jgi:aryl-alcohol dehydrogenase-like predicted oxidoreductase